MAEQEPVVVVGGGISGLACAFRLRQLSVPVILLESASRVGGLIGTIERDGFIFESGPQSFQGTDAVLDLIREVGVENELCQADPRAPRYVLRQGRLQKIPMSPQAMLSSSLLGVGTRLKIVSEALRRSKPPSEEESVAAFVRRKFGHEILEYLVTPFVSGIYAGDPEKLSLRAAFPTLESWEREYGSILRGAMKSKPAKGAGSGPPPLCSFQHGMDTLAKGIVRHLDDIARVGTCVEAVTQVQEDGRARYRVRVKKDGREQTIAASAVVMASPAYVASHLVAEISPALAKTLSGIAYAPVAVVAAAYYTKQIGTPPDGFGVLIPRSEGYRTLGTVWTSSLFPERDGGGRVTMTSFAGGATDPEIVAKPDEEIAAIVQKDNARILSITGAPITSAVWKHPKALPQYNLGHGHTIEAIRDGERASPGLFFAGNYLEGPSIGKCVEQASQTAEAVRAYLRNGTNNPP